MSELSQRAGIQSLRWLWLTVPVILIDQVSKWIVTVQLDEYDRINMLPFFDLVRFHNTGAAFSLLADAGGWQHWFFTGVAVIVSLGIFWYQWTLPEKGCRTLAMGLALILAGAIGNLIDRLMFGYVVDFLFFYYNEWSFPAFNVADSVISIGVTLVLFDSFFLEQRRRARRLSAGD